MTLLTSFAKALAAETGRAQPIRTVRHVHISDRPLMFVPLQLAGEACAPLAALAGDDPGKPMMLTVYEPRDRTQRFEFAASLADVLLGYIDGSTTIDPGPGQPCDDAPQLLVPSVGGVAFARLLGRSTRFRRSEGDFAVSANVPLLGRWLTFYSERTEAPASALFLDMVATLTEHWATGQSPVEDANLAALMAWIDPPPGMTGAAAARAAEDPVRWPPAGPATDPTFDNEVLAGRIDALRAARAAGDGAALTRAQAAMGAVLLTQLEPTWELMWRAVSLLRGLPAGAHVAERWTADRWAFTRHVAWLRDGGPPQPRRDSAVAAASKLARLEREAQRLEVQHAHDDDLVMAEYRLTGEAFAGLVSATEPGRLDTSGKRARLRPRITVETTDEVCFEPGAKLVSPSRPRQNARVIDVASARGRSSVVLELEGGMGRSLTPEPGSVPAVGETLAYTTMRDEFQRPPAFPDSADTPWTHGGPPLPHAPADDGAHNEQVDDLTDRLAAEHPDVPVGRLSAHDYAPAARVARHANVRADTSAAGLADRPVVPGTAAKWATVTSAPWPWAIVDEAYQMRSDVLLRIANLFGKALFVGDPGQLDPFSAVATERWLGLSWDPMSSAVAVLLNHNPDVPVHPLPVSWRLPASAAPVVSEAFYPFSPFRSATVEGERRLGWKTRTFGMNALDVALETAAESGWALYELPHRHTLRTDRGRCGRARNWLRGCCSGAQRRCRSGRRRRCPSRRHVSRSAWRTATRRRRCGRRSPRSG